MAYTKKNTTPATKDTKPERSHYHRAGSTVLLSAGMVGYTPGTYGRRVSVWVADPITGFEICRHCGIAKPVFGRPRKVAPTEATTCGGVERIIVAARPSLFGGM